MRFRTRNALARAAIAPLQIFLTAVSDAGWSVGKFFQPQLFGKPRFVERASEKLALLHLTAKR